MSGEGPIPRSERLRRLRRLVHPRVWRALFHGLTDPANDPTWELLLRRGTARYLEQPLPWFAPGAAEYLAGLLRPGMSVLEWGAGSSTLWFERLGCKVTSLETDPSWAGRVRSLAGEEVVLHLVDPTDPDYAAPAVDIDGFDAIVIDGVSRPGCARFVLDAVRGGSPGEHVVVFDDSHRPGYAEALAALSESALSERHFCGTSTTLTVHMTSVFTLGKPSVGRP